MSAPEPARRRAGAGRGAGGGAGSGVSDWLAGGALRLAHGLLGRLPEGVAVGFGRAAGAAARSALRVRRDVVEAQIAASFPRRSRRWVEGVCRAVYRHFGRELGVTLAVARSGPAAVLRRLENPGALHEGLGGARSRGGGVVVVTGHLGNWELLGSCAAAVGWSVVTVARSQGRRLDANLSSLRRSLGVTPVLDGSSARLPSALAAGAAVGLVADQHAGPRGIRVPFLGRPASTFRGPARLAMMFDVPLLFGALLRRGEGYRLVLEEVPRPRGPDVEAELTRRWVAKLERQVRSRPEQYFWFHRRWKPAAGERDAARGSAVGDGDAGRDDGRSGPGERKASGP